MKSFKTLAGALALCILAACGGGGTDEEPLASTQPVNCAASGVCK